MNKIEKLIEELCPQGVEFRAVEDITKDKFWVMPATPKFNASEEIPYITSKNIRGGNIDFTNVKYISRSDYLDLSRNRSILENDILISMIGTIGEVARVKKTDLYFYGQNMYLIRLDENLVNISYFLYYFDSGRMKRHFNATKNKSSQGYLKAKDIEDIQIPIPPLTIQKEIVKILDNFTQLEAELEAELEARKKQYEHYREELLTFGDDVERKPLGEVANIKNGKDWKKLDAGDIPVYGSGGVMGYVDTCAYDKPTVLIPRKGSITNIFYVETPIWNVDTIYYTEIDIYQIIPKFFYYFMKTIDLMKLDTGSGRPSLTQTILNKIKIPIPPLSKQKEIVSILDKFDALVNDISTGLPAEITARKKQYEYYRNQLLTFKPLELQDAN